MYIYDSSFKLSDRSTCFYFHVVFIIVLYFTCLPLLSLSWMISVLRIEALSFISSSFIGIELTYRTKFLVCVLLIYHTSSFLASVSRSNLGLEQLQPLARSCCCLFVQIKFY